MKADVDEAFLPWKKEAPLAARMRPRTLEEFVGQEHCWARARSSAARSRPISCAPSSSGGRPGAARPRWPRVIASATRAAFETLNAVLAGVKEIREVIGRAARGRPGSAGRRTILFVDEIHRFNKAQQDALLPHVEDGTITLIGATTENPYFEVNQGRWSRRSRIFELEAADEDDIVRIVRRALADAERGSGDSRSDRRGRLVHFARMADGDARNALNALELAVVTTSRRAARRAIDARVAEESIQRRALLYDKDGDVHYDTISAFIKSMRGSDPDAALYWMARMIAAGEDPRFIGAADGDLRERGRRHGGPAVAPLAGAAASAVEFVGLPECQFALAQACASTSPRRRSRIAPWVTSMPSRPSRRARRTRSQSI